MKTQFTISINKAILERAKVYAKDTRRSLSEIIENYLDNITQETSPTELSPKLKSIVGVVKLPKDFDEKKELRFILEKKHI
jgi:formiminotetrahydrofolate cyclodeaminase